MLGLSSGLIKGASTLRSIVKSGLQAWYKADKTQAPFGEDQIVNGNYINGDPNNSWSISKGNTTPSGNGWVINDGYVEAVGTGTNDDLTQSNVLTVGRRYIANLTISDIDNGSTVNKIIVGDLSFTSGQFASFSTNGTHTHKFTAGDSTFVIRRKDNTTVKVSNVSVREVTNSIKDSSTNVNDATLYSGTALNFDGSADIVTIGDLDTANKSLAFWFNPDVNITSATSATRLFGFRGTVGESTHYWGVTLGAATDLLTNETLTVIPDGVSRSATTMNFDAGRWYRVAIVWNASSSYYDIYVDGVLKTDTTTGTHTLENWSNFRIGRVGADTGSKFDGKLADVQVYNKSWTASDVTFDYNNPDKDVFDNSSSGILPTDCKALYRLNEGAGDRLYNAAPVLGANIWDGVQGDDANWSAFGTNTISEEDGAVKLTGDGSNASGGFIHLKNASDLSEDLIVGKLYSLKFDSKVSSGGSIAWTVKKNSGDVYQQSPAFTSTSFTPVELLFTAQSADSDYLYTAGLGNGESAYIKNISLKEITPATSVAQTSWAFTNWVKQQPYIPQYAISSYSKKMIFDGKTDNVNCGNDSSIADVFHGGGTWSCWISPNNFGEASNPDIIVKGNVRIRVASDGGTPVIRFLKSFSSNNGNWKTPAINFSKLTHVVAAYDSSDPNNNPDVYVNGIQQTLTKFIPDGETEAPTGSANSDASSNLYVGGAEAGGDNNYEGFVDEISIFNKMLTQAEVQEIFNTGTALDIREHSAYSDVVAYWRNNGIDTWTDLSTNTNDGTVFNNYSEEVVNGIFSNAQNWIAGSGATLSTSGGHLVVEGPNDDDYVNAHQQLNLEVGSEYVLSFEMVSATKSSQVKIDTSATGTGSGPNDTFITFNSNIVGFGTHSGTFIAHTANPYIQLRSFGDVGSTHQAQFDNVSVKKLENQIRLQEVPLFNKDSFGLPMNKLRKGGLNFEEGYIQLGKLVRPNASAITLEAWVYAYDEGASNQAVIGTSSSSYLLYRPRSNNYYRLYIGGGSPSANVGAQTSVLALKQWHHIVAVYDKTLTKEQNIYVNGVSNNTIAGADADGFANPTNGAVNADVQANETNVYIGKYSGTNFYGGIIDDVKIYDRRLTLKEIKRNYNATKGRHKN